LIAQRLPLLPIIVNVDQPLMLHDEKNDIDLLKDDHENDYPGGTLLMHAAKHDDLASVNDLLDLGASLASHTPRDGITPLMVAAYHGHSDIITAMLLRAGLQGSEEEESTSLPQPNNGRTGSQEVDIINAASFNDGSTALIYAAQFGHMRCVELLCDFVGCDVHALRRVKPSIISTGPSSNNNSNNDSRMNNNNRMKNKPQTTFSKMKYVSASDVALEMGHMSIVAYLSTLEERDMGVAGEIIRSIDRDEDQFISVEEFQHWIRSLCSVSITEKDVILLQDRRFWSTLSPKVLTKRELSYNQKEEEGRELATRHTEQVGGWG
jgi:hypothetical protein